MTTMNERFKYQPLEPVFMDWRNIGRRLLTFLIPEKDVEMTLVWGSSAQFAFT